MLLNWFAFNPLTVELVYEQAQGDPTQPWGRGRKYFLLLRDERGCEKKIMAADFSATGGGMRLERRELNRQGRKKILSDYFVMNSLGHDLDQWVHYDLRTGKKLAGFKGAGELADEQQRATEEAQKRDQRPKLVINARGDEKRVR